MRLSEEEENELIAADKGEKIKYRTILTEKILKSPSDSQLIISGAGTGKTFLFNEKINYWINEKGVNANNIIVSSFINFIIADLKNNLNKSCNVYTLHKLAKIIVHRFLNTGGSFNNNLTNDFQITLEVDENNIAEDIELIGERRLMSSEITNSLKEYFSSPFKITPPSFMDNYFSLCTFYNVISFDDVILKAIQAISKNPDIFSIEKVIVDEYQDFNDLEQEFVAKLFENSTGGIIAGDDDQSIYSGKNANSEGIINIFNRPDWENSNLPFCSRCKSAAVVECGAMVCRKQHKETGKSDRIDKSFLPFEDNGEKINIVTLSKSSSTGSHKFLIEAEYIAKQIDPERIKNWNGEYPAYLILGMKNNHLKRIAEILKEKLGIDIGIKQTDPYKDRQVQILYSYIQLLKNPTNNLAYRRLLGLSSFKDKESILLEALSKGFSNLDNIFIKKIKSRLKKIQENIDGDEDMEKKIEKIVQILSLDPSNKYLQNFINSIKDRSNISQILSKIDDLSIEQKEQERASVFASPIQCLTVWGSKGLKADIVFVLGLEEGYLPKNNQAIKNEEIRLFYVAITRSIEKLYLLNCKIRLDGVHGANNGIMNPSIFLNWLPSKYINVLPVIAKKHLTN
jgi:DNA helicase-2/ATP-dependent DNA helicase PcrA